MKNIFQVSALELVENIDEISLVETIIRASSTRAGNDDENPRDWVSRQLAGGLDERFDPKSDHWAEYVSDGLDVLNRMPLKIELLLRSLPETDESDSEFISQMNSSKEKWLQAYALAVDRISDNIIALLLAENWMELRGYD